jgi:hypothetical protein
MLDEKEEAEEGEEREEGEEEEDSGYQQVIRMLGSPQGGKIVQLVESILGIVHLYVRVVDFSEKVVELLVVPRGEVTLEALDPVRFFSFLSTPLLPLSLDWSSLPLLPPFSFRCLPSSFSFSFFFLRSSLFTLSGSLLIEGTRGVCQEG